MLVETIDLGKRYGTLATEAWALRSVSFTVREGEWVAVRGPSGSGKSTLLQLLGGLDRPTHGEIRVGGRSLGALSERELARYRRRDVGFVFQSFNLLASLTALENVLLPTWIGGAAVSAERERAEALLGQMGLSGKSGSFPDELSGGEQQRVAMARALVMRPKILLADEPTGSLDTATGRRVMESLRRAAAQSGQTVIVVTHEASIAALADREIRIEDGKLRSDGERRVRSLDSADRNLNSPPPA